MACIRRATMDDLPGIQQCNFFCLLENYSFNFFKNHVEKWPQLNHVAQDYKGRIVGYVLAVIVEHNCNCFHCHGHIVSLGVLRSYRRLGIATKLMTCAQNAMENIFLADYVLLQVRVSNRAALNLYIKTMGYDIKHVVSKYYRNGEGAFEMKKDLKGRVYYHDRLREATERFERVRNEWEEALSMGESESEQEAESETEPEVEQKHNWVSWNDL